jgi:TFIIF-interacting CTD phosphatase-like protein
MGKPFGKQPKEWLRLPTTVSFLNTLSKVRKSPNSDYQPVIIIRGNPASGGGTWFHEDVAIEYAGWLSDDFKIWCNDKMKVLKKNSVNLQHFSGIYPFIKTSPENILPETLFIKTAISIFTILTN